MQTLMLGVPEIRFFLIYARKWIKQYDPIAVS